MQTIEVKRYVAILPEHKEFFIVQLIRGGKVIASAVGLTKEDAAGRLILENAALLGTRTSFVGF